MKIPLEIKHEAQFFNPKDDRKYHRFNVVIAVDSLHENVKEKLISDIVDAIFNDVMEEIDITELTKQVKLRLAEKLLEQKLVEEENKQRRSNEELIQRQMQMELERRRMQDMERYRQQLGGQGQNSLEDFRKMQEFMEQFGGGFKKK
jgi:hypothetical protein